MLRKKERDVDGGWSDWVEKGWCCKGKIRVVRNCDNPAPLGNGADCEGDDTQFEPCPPEEDMCIGSDIDGGWSDWAEDGVCCDGKVQVSRTCTNPSPSGKGADCAGPANSTQPCSPDLCLPPDVDGGWSEWQKVGICCNGEVGARRDCNNPAPSGNGADCQGPATVMQPCAPEECTPASVDGGWSDWTDVSSCCNGEKQVTRTCTNPAPSGDGKDCQGNATGKQECFPDAIGCIPNIDGGWSDWEDEGCCNGVRNFFRFCNNPEPSGNGRDCEGKATEQLNCYPDDCAADTIDGGWSSWKNETGCCNGVMVLTRSCTNPEPSGGGKYCVGLTREVQTCFSDTCEEAQEAEEGWTEWKDETVCCNGLKIVKRECEFGATCSEKEERVTRQCYPDECSTQNAAEKTNGDGWGEWHPVGFCCFGKRPYTRECANPDLGCDGPSREDRSCFDGEICGAGPEVSGALLVSFGWAWMPAIVFLAL